VPLHADAPPPGLSDELRSVIDALRRHIWAFISTFLAVIALTAVFVYIAVPAYTGIATIIVDPRKQTVSNSPDVLSNMTDESSVIDTQVQIVQSRVVLGKALDDVLAQDPQLKVHYPRYFIWQHHEDLELPTQPDSAPEARDDLIDLFILQLDVERIGLSSAFTVSYKDENPKLAARVTNAISNAYIKYQGDLKQRVTRDADKWLKLRVAELKGQFESAQAALDGYRSRSGLIMAKGSTSTESQLTNLDVGLTDAQQNLSEAQSKVASYQRALDTAGAGEAAKVVSTPMMQQLRGQYLTLANQIGQLSPTLGANYPQMVELNKQLDTVREQMAAEANRTLGELKNDVNVAQNKVRGLLAIRDQSRGKLVTDNAAGVKLAQLQSDADTLRAMYSDMLTRLQQVTAQENAGEVNAEVVSQAPLPSEPSFPKLKLVIVAALGAGLAFGSLAVLLAQIFDGVILQPKDLERKAHIPILALVPRLRSADLRAGDKHLAMSEMVIDKPLSLFAESFRSLRVAVQRSVGSSQSVVVQITSGTFGEGKTTCAMAFAQAAAMDGRRVLLVDADVRMRTLTRTLRMEVESGLMELLRGKAQLRDVIRSSGENRRPHVLPLSTTDIAPHDRFSSETFDEVLDVLRRGFDLIVIDSAPVLSVADSLALTRRVDAVVLVTKWAKTPLEIVLKSIEEIERAGGRVAGMLLNQVNIRKVTNQRYGRGYYPAMLKYYRQ
jgi:polysaccharide biosynthesis transport protein